MLQLRGKDSNMEQTSDIKPQIFSLQNDPLNYNSLFSACILTYTPNFNEEIAVAAGRLKKAAVEPKRLVAHQVEHGVHFARIGEHLAMVSHPLAAFDL